MSEGIKKLSTTLLRSLYVSQIAILVSGSLFVYILAASPTVSAANTLTSRSVTISSGSNAGSNATTTYTLSFVLGTTGSPIAGIKVQACTSALNACTGPTNFSWGSSTYGSISNFTNTGAFTKDTTGANDCSYVAASTLCLNRTAGANETGSTARTVVMNNVQNPTTLGTYFLRITTYSTNTYTVGGILDTGTVATSTTQALTISASVQEVLSFCVGSTAIDNATSSVGADCSAVSGTSVNLGTLDSSSISVTPVSANGGSNTNAVAMLRTNGVSGATISYKAVQQSGTNHLGTLRVSGQTCNAGSVNTDPCVDAQGGTQGTFTAGTEKFGMTVAGTNCGSTGTYSCVLTSGTNNLKASSNYIGATATSYGTSAGYAWVEGGTATQIASSSTVVDDEALIIKFAATPSTTTPTGSYSALADFIAVATF